MGINNPSFVGDDDRPTLESGNGVNGVNGANAVSAISTVVATDEQKYRNEENGKMPAVILFIIFQFNQFQFLFGINSVISIKRLEIFAFGCEI